MGTSFHVVVIEDDPDLRKLIQSTLQFTAGWEVATAADGPAGIAAVRSRRPDAVVVDLMLPGMDGYAVCRALKADPATAAIPLVLLTARKGIDEAEARGAGAAGVIFKPFTADDLAKRIATLCAPPKAPVTGGPARQPTDHEREVAAVRREFIDGLTARVAALRAALERLSREPTRDAAQAFHVPAHALKGTAASFGADELVPPATELAALARRWVDDGAAPPVEQRAAASALERLAVAVERYRARAGGS